MPLTIRNRQALPHAGRFFLVRRLRRRDRAEKKPLATPTDRTAPERQFEAAWRPDGPAFAHPTAQLLAKVMDEGRRRMEQGREIDVALAARACDFEPWVHALTP